MRSTISLSPRQMALAVALVAGGGAVGTLARDLALRLQSAATPSLPNSSTYVSSNVATFVRVAHPSWSSHVPWVLLGINFLGVYAAVVLLRGILRHHDPNDPMRLLLVTGLLGGFTSYSSLFVSLGEIWHLSVPASLGVAGGAVASGLLAAWLGLRTMGPRR
ncbi:MAG TPA: CrcB family protein [Acidimicrobiales bacterium]|nr:CrcB family protein [Acidimicrobiales bacterium]